MKKKLLGYVGVDSGQLMITDPCYIESQWEDKDFVDTRMYMHLKTKRTYIYTKDPEALEKYPTAEPFAHYEAITSNGKTMNEMEGSKEVMPIPLPETDNLIGTFSYGGISQTTIADQHQIHYQMGHPGVAVAFRSGYGDGTYPVYGYFNKDGRCVKVEINMK